MRVTSDFFVSALIRRAFSLGGFAAISRKGASEAGAVMLLLRNRFGEVELFAPAAQTSYDEAKPDERYFTSVMRGDDEKIQTRIDRETKFDPDIWVVEFEIEEARFRELVSITTL